MVIILLVISILILVACYLVYYKNKSKKLSWPLLILPTIIATIVMIVEFSLNAPLDTRLVEYAAETIRHYPTWAETIYVKEGDTVATGDYKVSHHEYFAMMYRNSEGREEEKEIPGVTYNLFKHEWSDNSVEDTLLNTRGFNRCKWPKDIYNALVYTKTEPYVNYFQNILRLYNFESVSEKEAFALELYPRARMDWVNSEGILEPHQTLIYGLTVPDSIFRAASYVSTVDHRFRPIIVVWKGKADKEKMISKQKSFWDGGKDNEVVFCVCINDTLRKQILWSGSFSWANNRDFEEYILTKALHPGEILNMEVYIESLMEGYQNDLWQPKDFQNYSIASVPVNTFIVSFLGLFIITLNVILIFKIVQINPLKKKNGSNKRC